MKDFDESDLLEVLQDMPDAEPENRIWWCGKWRTVSELRRDIQFVQRRMCPNQGGLGGVTG